MPSPLGTCASIDSSSLTNESWPPGVAGYPAESWLGCQTKSPVLSPGCSLPLASVQEYCVSAMMIGLPNLRYLTKPKPARTITLSDAAGNGLGRTFRLSGISWGQPRNSAEVSHEAPDDSLGQFHVAVAGPKARKRRSRQ